MYGMTFIGMNLVSRHSAVRLLSYFSIAPCYWPFLSTFLPPLSFLDLSSHNSSILAVAFLVLCSLRVPLSQHFSVVSRQKKRYEGERRFNVVSVMRGGVSGWL